MEIEEPCIPEECPTHCDTLDCDCHVVGEREELLSLEGWFVAWHRAVFAGGVPPAELPVPYIILVDAVDHKNARRGWSTRPVTKKEPPVYRRIGFLVGDF